MSLFVVARDGCRFLNLGAATFSSVETRWFTACLGRELPSPMRKNLCVVSSVTGLRTSRRRGCWCPTPPGVQLHWAGLLERRQHGTILPLAEIDVVTRAHAEKEGQSNSSSVPRPCVIVEQRCWRGRSPSLRWQVFYCGGMYLHPIFVSKK